jgi:uncharacterized protein (DUF608 family)
VPAENDSGRRDFLKSFAAVGLTSGPASPSHNAASSPLRETQARISDRHPESISYPRTFTGPGLKMISFPLGGIGAGSIGLGGRGQLRDWEIFNRPDKGNSPQYAFASIWVSEHGKESRAHVLEARLEEPYEGQDGLGSQNAPGLSRLQGATFTGEFPQARIDFHDDRLPVKISLGAGTPFIPLDPDNSGLPLAVLRYRVTNTSGSAVTASIALSVENPVKLSGPKGEDQRDGRVNEHRSTGPVQGISMQNLQLSREHVDNGSFAIGVMNAGKARYSELRGWPAGRWWNSPLLFWDDFSLDGELGPETAAPGPVGAVCLKQEIAPAQSAEYAFVLAWHFPNRTPQRCGWTAPKGYEDTIIGNWYTTRFADAWAVIEHAAAHLDSLEHHTGTFVAALRESTVAPAIKDAAMANLSTLVSTTCFRTADGEFHAFEGSDDHTGCCFGNCTHVWNYESATAHLFPTLSHSLRRSAFGYSMDERGGMYFRQLLPDRIERFGYIAADGQMGQIMKVYGDWQLSGDRSFLEEFWPKVKRAISFAWIPGGWDENRDGVMEGVQHNTYDVEFYGPNPLCGIYYLGALRACEEMAREMKDDDLATEYKRMFDSGRKWLETNLFNGSYYIQKVEGRPADAIATGLRSGMGADDPTHPQYQVGSGCLIDQLLGQYLAHVAGLGWLLDPNHIRATLRTIYLHNHKPDLFDHDCVQRTYALNDEAATVVCDYAGTKRPRIPFPYYAEVWTGLEYSTAALMLFEGMSEEGLQIFSDARRRYNGERRNPWDEPECGHHYARAMASWSGLLAASGFRYRGQARRMEVLPPSAAADFRCFWSAGTGWGMFTLNESEMSIAVEEGQLLIREVHVHDKWPGRDVQLEYGGMTVPHHTARTGGLLKLTLDAELNLQRGRKLIVHA